jgi:signal transduction histidine kinase/CheY-like chemotaxis protein
LTLREAASWVFALAALLPVLLLVWILSYFDLLGRLEAQLGLVLALVVAFLGFVVFRQMVDQITNLARSLQMPTSAREAAVMAAPKPAAVPGLGEVQEIGQVADAFQNMIADLRAATQRLEDLVFKLGTLNELVELAARIPKIQDLLSMVLQSTMRAVHATIGSIMILDKDRQTLRLAASRGIPDDVLPRVEAKVGEGIVGKVVEMGEPVLVEDIESDPRFQQPNAPRYGSGSFICIPIRVGDRVIGVINMAKRKEPGSPRPQPFSSIDLQFLNALMTYIGYAVDNARLLEEAQQTAQQLQGAVDDLKATQAQLVRGETLRAMGQLSSGMAHHLNNLFAVILGRTELLLAKVEEPGVRRSLEIVQRTAQDGAEVVRRVQRFSRVQPVTEPQAVDLNQLAQEVIELTRPRWHDEAQLKGARIEVRLEAGRIPAAAGEPAPLREVLMNLLLNATDALPKGGTVTFRTWVADDQVHCAVIDTGVGMTEEVRRRALEPFFTTKGPKSTGLGLSVAYGTIERHGGSLTIESEEGRGTTVTISLPVASKAAAPAPPPPAPVPAAAPPLRVLVIDDEMQVRHTLVEILESQGHTVMQAASGQEGLAVLQREEVVDVVLTDLGMPDMTGWDVARQVQEKWPQLPVGLITGWGEQDLSPEQRGRVNFILSKPFDRALLRETLAPIQRRA